MQGGLVICKAARAHILTSRYRGTSTRLQAATHDSNIIMQDMQGFKIQWATSEAVSTALGRMQVRWNLG